MSIKGVEEVLSRAMSDATFAESLFADAEKALVGFDLTAEEADSFKTLFREDLSKMAQASPEERKSFGWSNHNQTALKVIR